MREAELARMIQELRNRGVSPSALTLSPKEFDELSHERNPSLLFGYALSFFGVHISRGMEFCPACHQEMKGGTGE